MHKKMIVSVFLLLSAVSTVLAQTEACPAIVQAAVASTLLECASLEAGQVCYGNAAVTVETSDDSGFRRRGDTVSVSNLQSLTSGPMNLDEGEWGMALLRVQANTPTEVLTYIVVGDVHLENASAAAEPVSLVNMRVREVTGANVRTQPQESADLLTTLLSGDVVKAVARLADDSWLRVLLPAGGTGWVRADLMRAEGDLSTLEVAAPEDDAPLDFYSPFQAFDFRSGVFAAFCSAAPDSGLLVQSPDDAGALNLLVNGVALNFDGTLFLHTEENNTMAINVLEGAATVSVGEARASAEAGERLRLAWNAADEVYNAPAEPEPYLYVRMQALPLSLLPRPIPQLEFNLLGVVTPAPRSGSPLDGLTEESPCTVAPINEVRLRQGPGREYPITARLFPGESARPEGRAEDSTGVVWWKLAENFWVSFEVVFWEGRCPQLAVIPAPPLPNAAQ